MTADARQAPMQRERIPGAYDPALDGIRAIAIALVMASHFTDDAPAVPSFIRAFAGSGWMGVDLFFVLSGFLISGICLDNAGPGFFRAFYIRRALRILPPYAAVLALILLGDAVASRHALRNVWALPTFTTNIVAAASGYWSALPQATWHFWSLAVEEQFYLIWPWVAVLVSRRSARTVALAAIPFALVIRSAMIAAGTNRLAPYVLMPARMDGLAAGAVLAILLRDTQWRAAIRHAVGHLAQMPVRRWAVALVALCLAVSALSHDAGPYSPLIETAGFTFIAAAAALTIATVTFSDGPTPLRRTLSQRHLVVIGRYSYAMYLIHVPVNVALRSAGFTPMGGLSAAAFTMFAGAITFCLAALSWRFVETPMLSLKRYATYRRGPARTSVASDEASQHRSPVEL